MGFAMSFVRFMVLAIMMRQALRTISQEKNVSSA
uniref:Uncharacterized protein n=1 Tax=Rhizophora mucronata TaxID=61149 RepID=A0A2P2NXH5_RHIMU